MSSPSPAPETASKEAPPLKGFSQYLPHINPWLQAIFWTVNIISVAIPLLSKYVIPYYHAFLVLPALAPAGLNFYLRRKNKYYFAHWWLLEPGYVFLATTALVPPIILFIENKDAYSRLVGCLYFLPAVAWTGIYFWSRYDRFEAERENLNVLLNAVTGLLDLVRKLGEQDIIILKGLNEKDDMIVEGLKTVTGNMGEGLKTVTENVGEGLKTLAEHAVKQAEDIEKLKPKKPRRRADKLPEEIAPQTAVDDSPSAPATSA